MTSRSWQWQLPIEPIQVWHKRPHATMAKGRESGEERSGRGSLDSLVSELTQNLGVKLHKYTYIYIYPSIDHFFQFILFSRFSLSLFFSSSSGSNLSNRFHLYFPRSCSNFSRRFCPWIHAHASPCLYHASSRITSDAALPIHLKSTRSFAFSFRAQWSSVPEPMGHTKVPRTKMGVPFTSMPC